MYSSQMPIPSIALLGFRGEKQVCHHCIR